MSVAAGRNGQHTQSLLASYSSKLKVLYAKGKNVFRLYVSVHNIIKVQVLDGRYDLKDDTAYCLLRESSILSLLLEVICW
jgi:hypothetical protein